MIRYAFNDFDNGYLATISTKHICPTNRKGSRIKVDYNGRGQFNKSKTFDYYVCQHKANELGFRGESGIHSAAVALFLESHAIEGTEWHSGKLSENQYVFVEM